MAAMLLTVISLLGVPPGQEADPGITWETVAVQVLEESPETAARTLLDWAEAGASAPPQEVGDLLEARTETTAEAAASFAAVLDAADGLRAAGRRAGTFGGRLSGSGDFPASFLHPASGGGNHALAGGGIRLAGGAVSF